MFSLICAWINGWVKNGEAGDLRRHRTHHDVTVMRWNYPVGISLFSCRTRFCSYITVSVHDLAQNGVDYQDKLEIVDRWSTRIPPPHRRGWQWAIEIESIYRKYVAAWCNGGLQLNIVQNHKAAILKATKLTIVKLLPTATRDMHMRFETENPKQTWVTLPKPYRPETGKI